MKLKIFWFVVLISLYGCSKPTSVRIYDYPSYSEDDFKRDLEQCFRMAFREVQIPIDKQLEKETGLYDTNVFDRSHLDPIIKEAEPIFDDCMSGKGYTWTHKEKK